MEDDELKALRAKRMAEIRGEKTQVNLPHGLSSQMPGGMASSPNEEQAAKKEQMEEMRRAMLTQILNNEGAFHL